MRRLALTGVLVAASLAFAACSLNPQPYPPSAIDTGGSADASVDSNPFSDRDGSAGDSGPALSDAGAGDASIDAGDASSDAGLDASDAESDADAAGDAESDATGD